MSLAPTTFFFLASVATLLVGLRAARWFSRRGVSAYFLALPFAAFGAAALGAIFLQLSATDGAWTIRSALTPDALDIAFVSSGALAFVCVGYLVRAGRERPRTSWGSDTSGLQKLHA